jgi:AcrR family transcriptional regulator
VQRSGPRQTTLSDIATDIGITRPTIYRYFASIEDLLAAAAEVALDGWTARIGDMSKDISDAVDLLTEAVAFLIERLPDEPLLAQLLEADRMRLVGRQMVIPAAVARSRAMLENTKIDWAAMGFTGARFDDLVEFLLRMIQSMVIAPSEPPRTGAALRDYLRQWIGPVVGPAAQSAPAKAIRKRR